MASSFRNLRLDQWNGPTYGPGWLWIVVDGDPGLA